MYVRASIVEQLPDPLSPLFADMIDGAVTRSLQSLFQEFLQEDVIRESDVGLTTVNGYAYYRYSRSGMGRLMWKSPPAFRMLLSGGTQDRWRTYSHPRYRRIVSDWTARNISELTTAELLAGVQELVDAAAEYYTAVQTIIPVAATSEVLFTWFYDAVVRTKDDPPAPVFLLGYDSDPIRAEKSLYDLATWTRTHHVLADSLLASPPEQFLETVAESDDAVWHEWHTRFQAHLSAYGHAVYNLDFMNPVPADDPVPLLETVRFFVSGKGVDPYQRQQRSATRREEATAAALARLDPVRAQSISAAAALGAAGGAGAGGRAGRRWAGLASAAPHARRDRWTTPAVRRDQRARRCVLAAPQRDRGRGGRPRRPGGATQAAVARAAQGHPATAAAQRRLG